MSLIRRRSNDDAAIEIYGTEQGVIVQGTPADVALFIDDLAAGTREAGGGSRHLVVTGVQVAANISAYRQTHREYFEFSPRALNLLREHGRIPSSDGFFRSFVRSGPNDNSPFAGNLDWKPIDFSPEQALSLQNIAAQMAIRAAIKDVVAAIERVEGKVDEIADLVKAERRGAAIADRGTLWPMVERVRATGQLSSTDWASIATLGPWIARDIESIRSHLLKQLATIGAGAMVRGRASDAENFTRELVRESVALLVVSEHNYGLWQELRIAHAATHERHQLANVTSDVRKQLAAVTVADQALLDRLAAAVEQLTEPRGFEGLAPLQSRKLLDHSREMIDLGAWFATQRHLDYDPADLPEFPGLGESISNVGHAISDGARTIRKAITDTRELVRNTPELDTPPTTQAGGGEPPEPEPPTT